MGIYEYKSKYCNCRGSWSTLDSSNLRTYYTYCFRHQFKEDNCIYYNLFPFLNYISKDKIEYIRGTDFNYLCKILKIVALDDGKTIMKIEVYHKGELDESLFNDKMQTYYSKLDYTPTWKKVAENCVEFCLIYDERRHNIGRPEDLYDV